MTPKNPPERVAFSPGEFAELFGKSQSWGYRQIYAGKVKVIEEFGRKLIAAAEVEAILKTAGVYDGLKPKPAKIKAEIQKLTPPRLENAWTLFLAARRHSIPKSSDASSVGTAKVKWPVAKSGRQAALARLTGKGSAKNLASNKSKSST